MSDDPICQDCDGRGDVTTTTTRRTRCATCHGVGRLPASWPETADVVCYTCNGAGEAAVRETETHVCRTCNGVGRIRGVTGRSP
jgi:DnaJ-class molecular chaperone